MNRSNLSSIQLFTEVLSLLGSFCCWYSINTEYFLFLSTFFFVEFSCSLKEIWSWDTLCYVTRDTIWDESTVSYAKILILHNGQQKPNYSTPSNSASFRTRNLSHYLGHLPTPWYPWVFRGGRVVFSKDPGHF